MVLNPCVKYLFEDSKQEFEDARGDRPGPIFELSTPFTSMAVRALDAIADTLFGNPTHWSILRGVPGAWSAEMRLKAQTMMLRLSAQVWFRLALFYRFWPWRRRQAIDDSVDMDEQHAVSEELFNSNACCLDEGASAVIQDKMSSATGLEDDKALREFAPELFKHTKAQTIPVEEGFKRVRTTSATNSGGFHNAKHSGLQSRPSRDPEPSPGPRDAFPRNDKTSSLAPFAASCEGTTFEDPAWREVDEVEEKGVGSQHHGVEGVGPSAQARRADPPTAHAGDTPASGRVEEGPCCDGTLHEVSR